MTTATNDHRIVRIEELAATIGICPNTIRNRCKLGRPGYDPGFPKSVPLGEGDRCAVGWWLDVVLAHLDDLARHKSDRAWTLTRRSSMSCESLDGAVRVNERHAAHRTVSTTEDSGFSSY